MNRIATMSALAAFLFAGLSASFPAHAQAKAKKEAHPCTQCVTKAGHGAKKAASCCTSGKCCSECPTCCKNNTCNTGKCPKGCCNTAACQPGAACCK